MKTTTRNANLALAAAIALAAGCDATHVLGSATPDGSAGATGGGAAGHATAGAGAAGSAGVPSPDDAGVVALDATGMDAPAVSDVGAASRPEVGPLGASESWTGYVENYTFPSGSSAIHLTFATDASGNVAGQVVLGQGPPPPAPTNPNIGYPPALESSFSRVVGPLSSYAAEGYVYQIDQGTLASDRLRFEISLTQLWAGWCALQTTPAGSTTCVAGATGGYGPSQNGTCTYEDTATSTVKPIDCGKAALCLGGGSPCDCSAGGPCKVSTSLGSTLTFDIFSTGYSASGSENGLGSSAFNVHFLLDASDGGAGG